MQKLVKKSTDKKDTPWGLDWFVQAGHGGNGNRNCTLAEDATLATPAYPLVFAAGRHDAAGSDHDLAEHAIPPVSRRALRARQSRPNQNMWRWQSIQEFQYPLLEYLVGAQEQAAVHGRRVRRRRPRAHLDVRDHGPDAGVDLQQRLPTRPGLHAARQRDRARAVGVLLRSRRQRHEPRQHDRRRRRQATTGTAPSRAA